MSIWDLVNSIIDRLGTSFGGLVDWLWDTVGVLSKDNSGLVVIVLLLGLLLFFVLRRNR